MTVVNDVGGEDSISVSIYVNALPIAAISGPTAVKTGTIVSLDGSSSTDPENGVLQYKWDGDWSKTLIAMEIFKMMSMKQIQHCPS